MRALVTRWNRPGSYGRTGPTACEVDVDVVNRKLVVRFVQDDGTKMLVMLELKHAAELVIESMSLLLKTQQ